MVKNFLMVEIPLKMSILSSHQGGKESPFTSFTPWFPPRNGGAFYHLNLDCEIVINGSRTKVGRSILHHIWSMQRLQF